MSVTMGYCACGQRWTKAHIAGLLPSPCTKGCAVPVPRPRGFACLSPEERAARAGKGGRAAQASGKAHRFAPGSELARSAGRKGGEMVHARRRAREENAP